MHNFFENTYSISSKLIYDIIFLASCQEKKTKNPIKKQKKGLTNEKKGDIIYGQYGRRTVAPMPEWRNWQTPGT